MSWLEKNYEKAAVGGAAVVALGLAFFGSLKFNGVDEDFTVPEGAKEQRDPTVRDAALVDKAIASRTRQVLWLEPVGAGDRKLPLFTGVPLFVHKDKTDEAIDLLTAPQVHPPIDNAWWIEHGLDPGVADAPAQDGDSDGFTNLEEFLAKTNPMDAKELPSLLAKLRFQKDQSERWSLRPGFPEINKTDISGVRLYLEGKTEPANKTKTGEAVKPDAIFFDADPMKGRFKYLGLVEREQLNPRTQVKQKFVFGRFEDQKPNKKGDIHEFEAPLSESRIWADDVQKFDRSADLMLEGGAEKGSSAIVPERTRFGLPFSNPKKDYLLKKVTPEEVEVEYTDAKGETKSTTIPIGGLPKLEEK